MRFPVPSQMMTAHDFRRAGIATEALRDARVDGSGSVHNLLRLGYLDHITIPVSLESLDGCTIARG